MSSRAPTRSDVEIAPVFLPERSQSTFWSSPKALKLLIDIALVGSFVLVVTIVIFIYSIAGQVQELKQELNVTKNTLASLEKRVEGLSSPSAKPADNLEKKKSSRSSIGNDQRDTSSK